MGTDTAHTHRRAKPPKAGYNCRRGMSNNAVDAHRNNQKPISRFTAQDLRDADINISLGFAGWMGQE